MTDQVQGRARIAEQQAFGLAAGTRQGRIDVSGRTVPTGRSNEGIVLSESPVFRARTDSYDARVADLLMSSRTLAACRAKAVEREARSKKIGKWSGAAIGGLGGAVVGVCLGIAKGAAMGTMICPGYGTLVGGFIGGMLGLLSLGAASYYLGKWRGGVIGRRRGQALQMDAIQSHMDQLRAQQSILRVPRKRARLPDTTRLYLECAKLGSARFKKAAFRSYYLPWVRGRRQTWQREMTDAASQAAQAMECTRLPRTANLEQIAFDYELDAAEACDELFDALLEDDVHGKPVRDSEKVLAERFANAYLKARSSYHVALACFRSSHGIDTPLPVHLWNERRYLRALLSRAFGRNRRSFSESEGRQWAVELLEKGNSFRQLYLGSRLLTHLPQRRDLRQGVLKAMPDTMRLALEAMSGSNHDVREKVRRFDKAVAREMGRRWGKRSDRFIEESNVPLRGKQIELPTADEWQRFKVLSVPLDVLPRIAAADHVYSPRLEMTHELDMIPEERFR